MTKPMTDEWKDSLLRYCDVFDTKDGSYLNEHNVINFIEELLHQATSKAMEEVILELENRIKEERSLKINRQTSVPMIVKQAYGSDWVSHYYERHQGFISGLLVAKSLIQKDK